MIIMSRYNIGGGKFGRKYTDYLSTSILYIILATPYLCHILFFRYQDDDEECLHSDDEEEDMVSKPAPAPIGIYDCIGEEVRPRLLY